MSNTKKHNPNHGDELHEAHGADNPAPEANLASDAINIGLAMFRVGIKRYSEAEQDQLRWLWGYINDSLGRSKIELLRALGVEYKVVYDIFTGRCDTDISEFIALIEALKIKAEEKLPIIETIVTRRIEEACDFARDTPGVMVAIQGPTGRGKTYTVRRWAKLNNHGRSRYVRVPSGCSRNQLATELCKNAGIGCGALKKAQMEARLFKAFDKNNVIIIDEAGHLIPHTGSNTQAIELLRDLVDICECSVIMIFTDVYLKDIKSGPCYEYFEQFLGRIKFPVVIPQNVLRAEVEAIVTHYIPKAPKNVFDMAYSIANNNDGKLRVLFDDLQLAQRLATNNDRSGITSDDIKTAVKWRQSGFNWPVE